MAEMVENSILQHKYSINDFKIGNYIHAGAYGTVYSAIRRSDQREVALKFFGYTKHKPDLVEIEKEIHLMIELDGVRGACQLLGVMDDSVDGYVPRKNFEHGRVSYPILIMELLGVDLFVHLEGRGDVSLSYLSQAFRSAMLGLQSIHERNFLHRDLKIDNIVMASLSEDTNELKIIDFGLMIRVDNPHEGIPTGKIAGSPGCFAPETLLYQHYSTKSDIWQAGCILYTLLSGFPPFHADDDANSDIVQGSYYPMDMAPQWDIPSPEAKDLVCRMLTVDPQQRIDMVGILQHPWLASETSEIHHDMGLQYKARIRNLVFGNKLKRYIITNNAEAGLSSNSAEAARFYFSAFDKDGCGNIEMNAMIRGIEELIRFSDVDVKTVHRDDLVQLFHVIDSDGNGSIGFKEFQQFYDTLLSRTTSLSVTQNGCIRLNTIRLSQSTNDTKNVIPDTEEQYCIIS